MTTALPVPLEAIDALEAADLTYTDTTPEAEVRAVAAPVVAAELRAIAAPLQELVHESRVGVDQRANAVAYRQGIEDTVRRLFARADELETR